jgi:hypothetical protein
MKRRSVRISVGVLAGCLLVLAGSGGVAVAAPTAPPTPTPTQSVPPTPLPEPSATPPASPQPPAGAPQQPQTKATTATPKATTPAKPKPLAGYPRFYRATIKRGAKDGDVYHIKNVRELQYRLRWAKVYTGPITGNFGPLTQTAVKKYQTKKKIRATGVVDLLTWQSLIQATTLAPTLKRVPAACKQKGWYSCYDRASHQVFGFYNGKLWNVWLVRGGSKEDQTNPGAFAVFARFEKKNSTIYGTLMHYFQKFSGGEGLHGSITMLDPFVGHSHGCVNMYIADSKVLWDMTKGLRHNVRVYGAWA